MKSRYAAKFIGKTKICKILMGLWEIFNREKLMSLISGHTVVAPDIFQYFENMN